VSEEHYICNLAGVVQTSGTLIRSFGDHAPSDVDGDMTTSSL